MNLVQHSNSVPLLIVSKRCCPSDEMHETVPHPTQTSEHLEDCFFQEIVFQPDLVIQNKLDTIFVPSAYLT
jgi:hypothetical protein